MLTLPPRELPITEAPTAELLRRLGNLEREAAGLVRRLKAIRGELQDRGALPGRGPVPVAAVLNEVWTRATAA